MTYDQNHWNKQAVDSILFGQIKKIKVLGRIENNVDKAISWFDERDTKLKDKIIKNR
jgi:hypothetical protein